MEWNLQESLLRRKTVQSQYLLNLVRQEKSKEILQKLHDSANPNLRKTGFVKTNDAIPPLVKKGGMLEVSTPQLLITEKQRSSIKLKPSRFRYSMTDGTHTFWTELSCN